MKIGGSRYLLFGLCLTQAVTIGALVYERQLRMVSKTPVKPEWRERGMAGTMAS